MSALAEETVPKNAMLAHKPKTAVIAFRVLQDISVSPKEAPLNHLSPARPCLSQSFCCQGNEWFMHALRPCLDILRPTFGDLFVHAKDLFAEAIAY
jgi:hypothetical protein